MVRFHTTIERNFNKPLSMINEVITYVTSWSLIVKDLAEYGSREFSKVASLVSVSLTLVYHYVGSNQRIAE